MVAYRMIFNLYLFCFLLSVVVFAAEKSPVVKISDGVLKGLWKESTKGRKFASFEGVPYAKPPIGKDKFRPPQPLEKWKGVFNATEALNDCVHYDPFFQLVQGGEDCLYLNVYTPKPEAKDLPVVVLIHGGSFMYGAGSVYGPDHMLDRDLVLVTINYRLGPIGFISTGDAEAPGNTGLKDQVHALKWVKRNIKKFGGDPGSVTIMGVSAGAASVHYHYLSPMSKGLFTKGLAFSGSAFAPWAHALKPADKAKKLADSLDCPTGSSKEIMDCLKELSAEDIVEATLKIYDWKLQLFTPFVPTVEPKGTKNAFLTVSPFEATEAGQTFDGPLLVSVTSEEGLYPTAAFQKTPELLTELAEDWPKLAADLLQYKDSIAAKRRTSVANKIKNKYFKKKAIGPKSFSKMVQAVGDRLFLADSGRLARLHADAGHPTYMAKYSFQGEKSFSNVLTWTATIYGAAHADDILHVFKLPYLSSEAAEDMKMTRALINMIYSFSINGVPQLAKDAPEWTAVPANSTKLHYMSITSPKELQMRTNSDFGHVKFWDSLGFAEIRKLKKD